MQATHGLTTRRALFAGAAALTATATASAASASPLMAKWREHQEVDRQYCATSDPDAEAAFLARSCDLRDSILLDPITCRGDAAAKVRMAMLSLEYGSLRRGAEESALEQVARWLEAN